MLSDKQYNAFCVLSPRRLFSVQTRQYSQPGTETFKIKALSFRFTMSSSPPPSLFVVSSSPWLRTCRTRAEGVAAVAVSGAAGLLAASPGRDVVSLRGPRDLLLWLLWARGRRRGAERGRQGGPVCGDPEGDVRSQGFGKYRSPDFLFEGDILYDQV